MVGVMIQLLTAANFLPAAEDSPACWPPWSRTLARNGAPELKRAGESFGRPIKKSEIGGVNFEKLNSRGVFYVLAIWDSEIRTRLARFYIVQS